METDKSIELKVQLNNFIINMLKSEDFKEKASLAIKDEIKDVIIFQKEEFSESRKARQAATN
jgi:hypothetical protein